MKKCEKCQIKVDETESICPICGSVLTVLDENGNVHMAEPNKACEPDGVMGISFTQRLQGMLTRKSLLVAVLMLAVCFVYQFVMCLKDFSGLLSTLTCGALLAGAGMLVFGAKKEGFPKKAKAAALILYITAIVNLCEYILVIAAFAVSGALMILNMTTSDIFSPVFAGLGMPAELIGISIITAAATALAIMLPYFISLVKVTKSLKDGVSGKEITKIKGVGVFRIYTFIITLCSAYVILLTFDPSLIFVLMLYPALLIIADALFQFNKVLGLEMFV